MNASTWNLANTQLRFGLAGWNLRRWSWLFLMLAGSSALLGAEGAAVWELPTAYLPGQRLVVTNRVVPQSSVFLYVVEMQVPAGWAVGQVSHGGAHFTDRNLVRWGLFVDAVLRELTVELTPPLSATGTVALAGVATFNGVSVPVSGRNTLPPVPPATGTLVREFPLGYPPGGSVTITNRLLPDEPVELIVIEEVVPTGWTATNISDSGVFDSVRHTVKWGPFFNSLPRVMTYDLAAPFASTGAVTFSGTALFDQRFVTNTGASVLPPLPPVAGTAVRTLPSAYQPGTNFAVNLAVTPDPGVEIYVIEDRPPAGWTVADISHSGVRQGDGLVKWPVFLDGSPRALTYRVTPPLNTTGGAAFSGTAAFGTVSVPVTGNGTITNAPLLGGEVTRTLPATYQPLVSQLVRLAVAPAAGVLSQGIVETPPPGWAVTNISHGGTTNAAGQVRWVFFDDVVRELTYEVIAPLASAAPGTFSGSGDFGGVNVVIGGPATLPPAPPVTSSVTRTTSSQFAPGGSLFVTNSIVPEAGVGVQSIEDIIPAGFTVTNVSHGGLFDPQTRKLKWGPFIDNQPRVLTYRLLVAPEVFAPPVLTGQASFDGVPVAIGGAASVTLNFPPSLPVIVAQTTAEDVPVLVVFNVTDADTPVAGLVLSASADNAGLLPPGSLVFTNFSGQPALLITPAFEASGVATVTLDVTDGLTHATRIFTLTVTAGNDAPVITVPASGFVGPQDQPLSLAPISVRDDDLGSNPLRLTIAASASTLQLSATNAGMTVTVLATNRLVLEGPLAALNATLTNLALVPPPRSFGTNTLTLTAEDFGATGVGGPKTTTLTVSAGFFEVNFPPTLTRFSRFVAPADGQPVTLTFAQLLAASDAADFEGTSVTFLLAGLGRGTVAKNGQPAAPGETLVGPGDSLTWTPPLDSTGVKVAFSLQASDGRLLSASPVDVEVQLGKFDQVISFTLPASASYGTNFPITAAASSGLPVQLAVISGPATLTNGVLRLTNVGPVTVRATQPGDAFYHAAPDVTRSLTVTLAPLTITADNLRVPPGATLPALTASYAGLVNGDTPASLVTPPTLTTTAVSGSPAGRYDITVSGAADPRYVITLRGGSLVIGHARPELRLVFGPVRVELVGDPGQPFVLETAATVLGPWSVAGSATADAQGRASLPVSITPGERMRFFRALTASP